MRNDSQIAVLPRNAWKFGPLLLLFLLLGTINGFSANTVTTNQLGQGVIYKKYHYDNLYNSLQEIYIADINLNDPAPYVQIPYLAGGTKRTVSAHAGTVPGALACVNAQFFDTSGSVQFLKVNGVTINPTKPGVHEHQAITDNGSRQTNSVGIALRPAAGWSSLTLSNVIASGPELVKNGLAVTNYDMADGLVVNRHPRTCAAWTYDNHLLMVVVDGRSSIAAGMTLPELRDYLLSIAPVRNAFNFDGGGSSTMWTAGGGVRNVPSDGTQRAVANAVAIVAPPPALPLAPLGLKAVLTNSNVLLSWSVASGAMHYNVKRSTVSGGPYTIIGTSYGTSFTNSSVVAGVTNYFVVSAVNSIGESPNSSQTNLLTIPSIPGGLVASAGINQIILNWNPSTGASNYAVKRSTVNGGPYTTLSNQTANSYTNTGLINGTTYFYVVSAANSSGSSSNSIQVGATPQCTIPAAPSGLHAAMIGNQMILDWRPSPNATSYSLNRATNIAGPYNVLASGIPGTNYTDTLAVRGVVYFYKVSAANSCGTGLYSSEVSAPLVLSSPTVIGSNLVFSGWGGEVGKSYYILQSTNLATPLSNWNRFATNVFISNGAFRHTNQFNPLEPASYFLIQPAQP